VFAVLGLMQGPELFGFLRRTSAPVTQFAKGLGLGFAILAGIALLLIGWIVAIVGTVTKYHGFHVERHDKGLKVGYGLLTLIEHVIPLRRVQLLRVVQPVLYRLLHLFEIDVATAGSFGDKEGGGNTKLSPVVRMASAPRLAAHVFPTLHLDAIPWGAVSPLTVRRAFLAMTWVSLALSGAAVWRYGPFGGLALAPLLAASWLYARKRFEALGYALDGGFLCSRSGVMRHTKVFIPVERIQFVEVSSSFFQRRLGLASLEVRTASSFATADATIPDLPLHVARALQDAAVRRESS